MFWAFDTINLLLPFTGAGLVVVWAAVAGAVSMVLYGRFSPQQRLQAIKEELQDVQEQLKQHEGELDSLWPLMKKNLQLSGRRVWLSLGASLVAALPLILVMVCLDHQLQNRPMQSEANAPGASVLEGPSEPILPRLLVGKKADEGQVKVDMTTLQTESRFLDFGPTWMRSWIFLFICVSTVSALVVRQLGGIL